MEAEWAVQEGFRIGARRIGPDRRCVIASSREKAPPRAQWRGNEVPDQRTSGFAGFASCFKSPAGAGGTLDLRARLRLTYRSLLRV